MRYVVLDMVEVDGANKNADRVRTQSPMGYVNAHPKYMVTNPM